MCPPQSRFFDIGAGSGGMTFWKEWQGPVRLDIEMHGCDLFQAQFADRYTAFHVMNFDGVGFPYPDNYFEAALSSHVIEHLRQQEGMAAELARILKPGGMVYIETPTDESCHFPTREFFIAKGCPTTTINFFDDHTHTTAVSRPMLKDLFVQHGFILHEAGTIRTPYLEDHMLAKAVAHSDQEMGSYGLWSKLGFAHYAVFQKPLV
jgi:ubiquinone/menaquinone biosynthesis C-methylase UbiE